MVAHATTMHGTNNHVWKKVEADRKCRARLAHECRVVEDMKRRKIDVEKCYRWSELKRELECGNQASEERIAGKKYEEGKDVPNIEVLAGAVFWSENADAWKCRDCIIGAESGKERVFKTARDATKHHTWHHCPIRQQKIFHCPYCLYVSGSFSGIKVHLLYDRCRVIRVEELNACTWQDIIVVNRMISVYSNAEVMGGNIVAE